MSATINIQHTTADFRRTESKKLFNRIVQKVLSQAPLGTSKTAVELITMASILQTDEGLFNLCPIHTPEVITFAAPFGTILGHTTLANRVTDAIAGNNHHLRNKIQILSIDRAISAFGYAAGKVMYVEGSLSGPKLIKYVVWRHTPSCLIVHYRKHKLLTQQEVRRVRGRRVSRFTGDLLNKAWRNLHYLDNALTTYLSSADSEARTFLRVNITDPATRVEEVIA